MDSILLNTCENYTKNRNEMRRILRSEGAPMHLMGAACLTAFSRTPDEEKILAAENLLKDREPVDSPIRGAIKSVTTVHMMLADSMEDYYRDLRRTHDIIKVHQGTDDERYYMAALMMNDKISDMPEILQLVDRTSMIHEGMGKSFASVADKSSYVAAAYAAACGVRNVRAYIDKVRECESYLRDSGVIKGINEDMCMVLALIPETTKAKCERAISFYKAINSLGLNFERPEEATILAFLTGIDMPADEMAAAVRDADEISKLHSGFNEGEGIVLRHVYTGMLVTMAYVSDHGVPGLKKVFMANDEVLKRTVLMESQSVMHIQMSYVDPEDLHI